MVKIRTLYFLFAMDLHNHCVKKYHVRDQDAHNLLSFIDGGFAPPSWWSPTHSNFRRRVSVETSKSHFVFRSLVHHSISSTTYLYHSSYPLPITSANRLIVSSFLRCIKKDSYVKVALVEQQWLLLWKLQRNLMKVNVVLSFCLTRSEIICKYNNIYSSQIFGKC